MGGTLKITGLSLLAGAILLLAGVLIVDTGSWRAPGDIGSIGLDDAASVNNRPVPVTGSTLPLTFPDNGSLLVGLKFEQPIKAADYRYLHIALQQEGIQGYVAIAPRQAAVEPQHQTLPYTLENRRRGSLWINTSEIPGWTGELKAVFLALFGEPGAAVTVHDISVHGPSVGRRLAALYDDWMVYEPWDRAAMNTHTGVTRTSSFYPLLLAAGWLLLSTGCYTLYVMTGRGRRPWDWRVTGLVFLTCWLVIDMPWQLRLLSQIEETRAQFSGLSSEEKLRVGPDAKIVAFAEQLRQHIPPDARVFVESEDDYEALRTAYYLYPLNVYWRMRFGLPEQAYIRSGDYIAVMASPRVRHLAREELLKIPDKGQWYVDRVVNERLGKLYRVR